MAVGDNHSISIKLFCLAAQSCARRCICSGVEVEFSHISNSISVHTCHLYYPTRHYINMSVSCLDISTIHASVGVLRQFSTAYVPSPLKHALPLSGAL